MGFGDIIRLIFSGLFPSHDAGAEEIYRWRLTVATSIIFIGTVEIMQIGALIGWPAFMFAGFVQVNDIRELRTQQTEIRIAQIEPLIIDARERQCRAITEGSQTLQFFTTLLNARLEAYRLVALREYRLPSCDEVVAGKKGG